MTSTLPETKLTEELHYTDLGNSQRLVRAHGPDLHYIPAWGHWITYEAKTGTWQKDDSGEVVRRMKQVVIEEYRLALLEQDDDIRKSKLQHCLKMEAEPSIRRAILLAESAPGVVISHNKLDANPWALTCGNGTVNLKTGEIRATDRHDLTTKLTTVAFDPAALCPRFLTFLDEIFLKDKDLIEFIQRAVGYSLTGETTEHCTFICHGSGANGKTTLMRLLEHVLGAYALTADAQTFMSRDKGDSGPRNDVARLIGARLVTASELGEGRRLDEALVKSLTGGDTIAARFLHQEFFEFRPAFKLWISTNHKPHIHGTDEGIWRRIRLIPFKATFSAEKQDHNLINALLAEAPGILAWAVRGCLTWQENGLSRPPAVEAAGQDYRAEQDLLGSWIEDSCTLGPAESVSNSLLYRNFASWCETNGERPWSNKAFSMRLNERGLDGRKTMRGRVWQGIGISYAPENGTFESWKREA